MKKMSLIGESEVLQSCLDKVSRCAVINRPIIVSGERGSGKELIAERLHYLSKRWDQPLVKVNCAALNEQLLHSELFGHEAGAFTGANKVRKGRFELADGGSLFLDEIADTSLALQESLLRIIEYGEYQRLGGQSNLQCDVRIIVATNANLPALVRDGKFRADLLDRLAFDVINVPALRERGDDSILLAEHFALMMAKELSWHHFPGFSERLKHRLLQHAWPGNVRELKNVIERALCHWDDPTMEIDTIELRPFEQAAGDDVTVDAASLKPRGEEQSHYAAFKRSDMKLKDYVTTVEKQLVEQSLAEQQFHQGRTAEALGLSYHSLRAYLRRFNQ